jgi:16S rRNA (uracil1498-N3)-methyltransferase
MSERYFVDTPITSPHATLSGAEAHHLLHVMRARVGDDVTLFDGSGAEFPARIEQAGRSKVQLAVIARHEIDRELPWPLVLGVALPKGDRQRWLVEKAVELGVSTLVPLQTERGVAQPVESALLRLGRAVIEASKQCGRNRLMEIAPPQDWPAFVGEPPADAVKLVAHPVAAGPTAGASAPAAFVSDDWRHRPKWLAIGPEGGFAEAEVLLAQLVGWDVVDLGPRILRVETAALALVARLTG